MKYAIVTDFDGTVTMRDMAHVLVDHYGVKDVACVPLHASDDDAKIWMRCNMGSINTTQQEYEKTVKEKVQERPHFKNLVDYCQANAIPLEITSGGVDVYINPALEKFGVKNVPLYCANGQFIAGGIKIDYPLLENYFLDDFKASRVKFYKDKGYKTIYCGDAYTDYKAARLADISFSTATLYERLLSEGVKTNELTSFEPIIKILEGK